MLWRSDVARLSEFADVLPEGTAEAWPVVADVLPEGSALMGGTGLAVWLRHRLSADLDFFTPTRFDHQKVIAALSAAGDFDYDHPATERMIRGTFNSVNVDVVAHEGEYILGPPLTIDGLHVGSLQDITAGKFKAIATRKQLRDFVDVMFIETHGGINLVQGIFLYHRRHGLDLHLHGSEGFLRHLVDFEHVDDDPAMTASFGDDIRDRVVEYFRSRQIDIIATLERVLSDDEDTPEPRS